MWHLEMKKGKMIIKEIEGTQQLIVDLLNYMKLLDPSLNTQTEDEEERQRQKLEL